MRGICAASVLAVSLTVSTFTGVTGASAQFRIIDDRGGEITGYIKQFALIRYSGSRVVIDGPCLSACTVVLAAVPKDRICVTSRANLGFHAAWNPTPDGNVVHNEEGTQLLLEIYPPQVRNWIRRKGGLTPHMIYLRGKELASMYATCPSAERYAGETRSNPGRTDDGAYGRALFAAKRKAM